MQSFVNELLEKENSRKLMKKKQQDFRKELAMFYNDVDYKKIRIHKCKPIEYNVIKFICKEIEQPNIP